MAIKMTHRESRHHLPLNSMLFESTADLRAPLPANVTLVNLQEAADTSITALPTLPAPEPAVRKASLWARMIARIKQTLGIKKKAAVTVEREMDIGSPTGFQHHGTGSGKPLRAPVEDGRGKVEVVEEEEWEDVDVEDTKRFARG